MNRRFFTAALAASTGALAIDLAAQEHRSVAPQPKLDRIWLDIFRTQKRELQNAAARGPIDVCFAEIEQEQPN